MSEVVKPSVDGGVMRQLRPVTEAGEKDVLRAVVLHGEGAAFMAVG